MLTLRINKRRGRVQTPFAAPQANVSTVSPDTAWRAIVEQLLATPSDHEPYEAPADTEYAWARKLGMHVNRPPKQR